MIGEVGRAGVDHAHGVLAVAAGAVVGEHFYARRQLLRIDLGRAGWLPEGFDIGHDRIDIGPRQHLVPTEGQHLGIAGFGMGAVDTDANGFGDSFGIIAPHGGCGDEIGETRPALGVGAVAGRAIVAEQGCAGLADDGHQFLVGLDGGEVLIVDAAGPAGALGPGLLHALGDRHPLVRAQEATEIAVDPGPAGHQHGPQHGKQRHADEEEPQHAGNGRIEFLDAVPLVAGGHLPREFIAFLQRHGRSSSSRTGRWAASSKPFLLEGQ